MKTYRMTIRHGRLSCDPAWAAQRSHYLSTLPDGASVIETLRREGKPKTNAQVRTHWGLVVGFICAWCDANAIDLAELLHSEAIPPAVPVTKDVVQDILYAACNDVGEDGQRKTLSQMSTKEASDFFERCRNFAAHRWQIVIPEPDPNWKDKEGPGNP